jgi:capsular exopolysaccharide synthesis family protein
MSKIFDALNKKPGQIPDLGLSALWKEFGPKMSSPDVVDAPSPIQQPTPEPEPLSAPVQAEHVEVPKEPAASLDTSAPAIRTLPLRISLNSPLFPYDGAHWQAAEQYRMARTKILQHPRQSHMIVVSSATTADGKTLTAINVAGALALKGEGDVLLVDADFRRSTVQERLGLPAECGLAQVLAGSATLDQALIRAEQFPKLFILPAGATPRNPTELLGSSRWRTLCHGLSRSFRYVVMDSPPIGAVADYELIQAVCDGVLLVVRPDHTGRKLCFQALQAIPAEKLVGVLLNCVPKWFGRDYHYSSYYGAYGAYDAAGR